MVHNPGATRAHLSWGESLSTTGRQFRRLSFVGRRYRSFRTNEEMSNPDDDLVSDAEDQPVPVVVVEINEGMWRIVKYINTALSFMQLTSRARALCLHMQWPCN